MKNLQKTNSFSKILNFSHFPLVTIFVLDLLLNLSKKFILTNISLILIILTYYLNGLILIITQQGYRWTKIALIKVKNNEAKKRGIFELILATILLILMFIVKL